MNLFKDSAPMKGLARSLRREIPEELEGSIECSSEDGGETVTVIMHGKHVDRVMTAPWDGDLPKAAINKFTPKTRAARKPKAKHTNKVQSKKEVADNAG